MSKIIYFSEKTPKLQNGHEEWLRYMALQKKIDRLENKRKIKLSNETLKRIKKLDKYYPQNCIAKYYPFAKLDAGEIRQNLILPCGFRLGQSWGALRKCWKGYKLAKKDGDTDLMTEYAKRIQKIETEIGIPTASFPNLGLLGDIFFLYDKEKERDLRLHYYHDHIACDYNDMEFIKKSIDEGKEMKIFNSHEEMRREISKEGKTYLGSVIENWINSPKGGEFIKIMNYKWIRQEKYRDGIRAIHQELKSMRNTKKENEIKNIKITKEEQERQTSRRKQLLNEKILLESKLDAVNSTKIVETDTGYAYARQIIQEKARKNNSTKYYHKHNRFMNKMTLPDNVMEIALHDNEYDIYGEELRKANPTGYVPQFYLSDVEGRRLASYKEEKELGITPNDPEYQIYIRNKLLKMQQEINKNYNY